MLSVFFFFSSRSRLSLFSILTHFLSISSLATLYSYRLNFWMHGLNTFGYHVVNVLLHSLATYLFTRVAINLLQGSTSEHHSGGVIAGIFFALHPIHTEAVSSVVGRAETLSACFFCLAYLVYSRVALQPNVSLLSSIAVQLFVVFPLALLATLSKEGGL